MADDVIGAEAFVQLDRQRERWRRGRQSARMESADGEDFALGGLAGQVSSFRARLLVLPTDPEGFLLECDDKVVGVLQSEFTEPIAGRIVRWGETIVASRDALVAARAYGESWSRYIGVCRHGGLDASWGREVSWPGGLLLSPLVGRIWAALHWYADISGGLPGGLKNLAPFEVVLAVRESKGMVLAGFGEGWAEPHESFGRSVSTCPEDHLLLRREVMEVTRDSAKALAFSFGSQVENAFGSVGRRFLAHRGPNEGAFDSHRFAWL